MIAEARLLTVPTVNAAPFLQAAHATPRPIVDPRPPTAMTAIAAVFLLVATAKATAIAEGETLNVWPASAKIVPSPPTPPMKSSTRL